MKDLPNTASTRTKAGGAPLLVGFTPLAFLAFWHFPANPAFAGEASRWLAHSKSTPKFNVWRKKMDIDTLSKGIGLFSSALAALKQAISLLPDNAHKADAEAAYERAYRELKIAEAETANKLKYEICRAHFPPEIMLSKDDKIWVCPICDNKKDKRVFAQSSISKPNSL